MATAFFETGPTEDRVIGLDFTGKLPTGVTLSSGTVSAILVSDSSDATSAILDSTTLTIDSGEDTAKVGIKTGAAVGKYLLTFLVTLSDSQVLKDDVLVWNRSN